MRCILPWAFAGLAILCLASFVRRGRLLLSWIAVTWLRRHGECSVLLPRWDGYGRALLQRDHSPGFRSCKRKRGGYRRGTIDLVFGGADGAFWQVNRSIIPVWTPRWARRRVVRRIRFASTKGCAWRTLRSREVGGCFVPEGVFDRHRTDETYDRNLHRQSLG